MRCRRRWDHPKTNGIDGDSGSDGEQQADDDDDGNYTNRYGGQSSSFGVGKGCKFCGNHESADDRGQDAFAAHVDGDLM
jgi:hypothetical protein